MIDHLSIGVSDLDRSAIFYEGVLAKIGYRRLWRTSTAAGFGPPGGQDKLALFLCSPHCRTWQGFHLAFIARSRKSVRQFHAAALRLGGTDAGIPDLRKHYSPTYYAAFVLDPDGIKLEAVCQ